MKQITFLVKQTIFCQFKADNFDRNKGTIIWDNTKNVMGIISRETSKQTLSTKPNKYKEISSDKKDEIAKF